MENYFDRAAPLFPKGVIQLQTHGGEIRWRNVYVREIPADEANKILSADDATRASPRSSTASRSTAGPARSTTTRSSAA